MFNLILLIFKQYVIGTCLLALVLLWIAKNQGQNLTTFSFLPPKTCITKKVIGIMYSMVEYCYSEAKDASRRSTAMSSQDCIDYHMMT